MDSTDDYSAPPGQFMIELSGVAKGVYPMTWGQEIEYQHHLAAATGDAHIMWGIWDIPADSSYAAVLESITELLVANEALRTSLLQTDDGIYQQLHGDYTQLISSIVTNTGPTVARLNTCLAHVTFL
jgi:hypothetical protein